MKKEESFLFTRGILTEALQSELAIESGKYLIEQAGGKDAETLENMRKLFGTLLIDSPSDKIKELIEAIRILGEVDEENN